MLQHFVDKTLHVFFNRLRYKIEWGRDRHYDGSHCRKIGELSQRDRRKWRLTHADDQFSPLFETNRCSASEQRIANAARDLADRTCGSRDDNEGIDMICT